MKNITRNWKTTFMGLCSIGSAALKVMQQGDQAGSVSAMAAAITDPTVISLVASGVGLILAKDGDKSGTVIKPK